MIVHNFFRLLACKQPNFKYNTLISRGNYFTFLLVTALYFPQEKYIGLVEYTFVKEIGGTQAFSEYLLLNEANSFYFSYNQKKDTYEELAREFEFRYSNNVVKYEADKSEFTELRNLRSFYRMSDTPPAIQWEIKQETKEILGYTCTNAIGEFRGRTYSVWFASEVPFFYGPWKLTGLPGLILEARDNYGYFHYIAKEITLNKDFFVPAVLEEKLSEQNSIAYKEFIEIENDFFKDIKNKIQASRPRGTVFKETPLRELLKETKFEWE